MLVTKIDGQSLGRIAVESKVRLQRILHRFFLTALLALFALLPSPTFSESLSADNLGYLWRRPELNRVTAENMAFTETNYSSAMIDGLYSTVMFNGGWIFTYSIFHYNIFIFDRWGVYALVYDPEGNTYWAKATLSARDIDFDTERLYITDGKNLVEGGGMRYRIVGDFDGFSCDLVFDNYLPPWMLNDGTDNFTENGKNFQARATVSPWADVTGSMSIDGKWMRVNGDGVMEKTLVVNNLNRYNQELVAMRAFTPEEDDSGHRWHISLVDSTTHPDYGSKKTPQALRGSGR